MSFFSKLLKIAGVVAAPFTGGTSLALTTAAMAYDTHQDAKDAMGLQQQAIDQQATQGEAALQAQKDALAQQKAAADAALAEQKTADQARIDQANVTLKEQQKQFDLTYNASQTQAAQQLAATTSAQQMQVTAQQQAADAQRTALQAQVAAADRLYTQQSEQFNRANQKQPDTAAITAANVQSSKSGQSGTMLTGPAGVDLTSLLLGKNTLLGG